MGVEKIIVEGHSVVFIKYFKQIIESDIGN